MKSSRMIAGSPRQNLLLQNLLGQNSLGGNLLRRGLLRRNLLVPTAALCIALLAGCGASEPPPAAAANPSTSTQSSGSPENQQAKSVQVCDLITAAERAAIAGKPLELMPDEAGGRVDCVWGPPDSSLPRVELKIERGSAEAAMTAFGMLEKHEPGISGPYDDLGDEAVAIGPAVMIKRDEDLITITVMGVDDGDAAVRKIYETVAARM